MSSLQTNNSFPSWSILPRPVQVPHLLLAACLVLTVLLVAPTANAARVAGLYSAVVDMPEGADAPLAMAFDSALSEVLIKVTGLLEAGEQKTRASLFPNSGSVVQQYSMQPDRQVRVEFDQGALRRALDGAGFPVWGGDRPLLAIWLAVDEGGGRRQIIAEGNDMESALPELRQALTDTAGARGLPVVLPLVDAEDLAQVSFADVWGDFRQPVVAASARYGAGAVLIGRTRDTNPSRAGIRWTLLVGDEVASWQGDAYSGPSEAAGFLSRRLATFADSAGALRVLVKDVGSLERYGQLLSYFDSLGVVDEVGIARVSGNDVEFRVVVRGDAERLARALANSRWLEPADGGSGGRSTELPGGILIAGPDAQVTDINEVSRLPDLVYSWRQPK
jgi:hypothetical protein